MKFDVGFVGLIGFLFIFLKLLGALTWSWVWILSPFWMVLSLDAIRILFLKPWTAE